MRRKLNMDVRKKFNMDEDQYCDLLKILDEEIYKYAEHLGIDLNDEKKLIEACNTMKKIQLGKETTEMLLDGIMHCADCSQLVLKFIDLDGISFAGRKVRSVDFRGTNADVDPQTVEDKDLSATNFEGIDMSGKCFDGCVIRFTHLNYTNAEINPQTVFNKDLSDAQCGGLDLSQADFTGVCVSGTYFENAKIDLDPQTVYNKNLVGTNLKNVDMSGKDFSGCDICFCNLANTNAVLDLDSLNVDRLCRCNLQGTTLLVGEGFNRKQLEKQDVKLGQIITKDNYTLTKEKIKSIFKTINNQ